ncbi:hypothetical protein PRABACTJOHN_00182 [Parabacteroides johnsonii DSM 18315]|uniref:Uncharacterized protein n=1 Tax=Parabacteroides johnsonii DSM 18315 TaxID=537006 RepID=B7B5B9_9BACT|nr:hypothetical protein PRABACTJOHN_00182 [Parabacteroides johnsonii DSM 18315]
MVTAFDMTRHIPRCRCGKRGRRGEKRGKSVNILYIKIKKLSLSQIFI